MPSNNTVRSSSVHQPDWHLSRLGWSTGLDTSAWLCLILIVVALGLLGAFHQVTLGIVQQSELRLQNISAYNQATGHCNSLSDRIARQNCLSLRQVLASEISTSEP
ncbi:MAG: hypothetical protein FD135_3862 [Comamonadaceae bacterium]|nr:MAG: hypothetical protein FD135_3862 [Comamonadaceae bacterium]